MQINKALRGTVRTHNQPTDGLHHREVTRPIIHHVISSHSPLVYDGGSHTSFRRVVVPTYLLPSLESLVTDHTNRMVLQ